MSRRPWIGPLGIVLIAAAAFAGWRAWVASEAEAHRRERAEQVAERDRRAEERLARVREESAEKMPDLVRGIALAMPLEEVRALRPRMEPGEDSGGELLTFTERVSSGVEIVYGFQPTTRRLEQVQILSLLPVIDAIAPHLAAMNDTYGPPTGVWDCPQTGGVPTRRFTWRGSQVTIADVFLLYGGRVSQTLYVATTDAIGRSLQRSACVPVPQERIAEFPTATREQVQGSAPQR